MTCHPEPALREKDLLFFAPRDEVGAQCYSAAWWPQPNLAMIADCRLTIDY
jgi:hypothetical protein